MITLVCLLIKVVSIFPQPIPSALHGMHLTPLHFYWTIRLFIILTSKLSVTAYHHCLGGSNSAGFGSDDAYYLYDCMLEWYKPFEIQN